MKFDSLKLKKLGLPIYLIAVSVILLLALLFGLIFGFNKGFDFNGGTQIVVDLANDTIEEGTPSGDKFIDYASNKVKDIINKNHGKVHSFQVQSTNSGKSLIINIREIPNALENASTLRQIRLDINAEFNDYEAYTSLAEDEKYKILDQNFDITKNTTVIEGLIAPNTTIACIAALLFALTAVTVYSCFRLKLAGGLTLAFGGVLDVVLFCALMVLSRIAINAYFFALLAITLIISIYNSLDFFFNIKEKLKDPKLNSKTNKELATIVLKENFVKNVSIYGVCLGIALIVGLFGVVSILHLGLATIIALVVLFATHTFILPEFWVLLNKKNELVRPVPKQKKNEVEVSTTKNNNDKSAEEVVVEDDDELEQEEEETKIDSKKTTEENEEVEIEEDNSNDDDDVVIEVIEDTDSKKD